MEEDYTPPNPVVGHSPSLNESDQASQSENNPRFSRNKKLLIVYIVIMIALLIAGLAAAFMYQNSNQDYYEYTEDQGNTNIDFSDDNYDTSEIILSDEETDDWREFEGDGFTIKHPQNLSIELEEGLEEELDEELEEGKQYSFKQDGIYTSIAIYVGDNSENLELKNAFGKGPYTYYDPDEFDSLTRYKFDIDGENALSIKYIPGYTGSETETFWINNGKIYQAFAEAEDDYNLLLKILATFKFTN